MAAGDITPTTPRADVGLTLKELLISADGFVALRFVDSFGGFREAVMRNGTSIGFDYATGAQVTVSTPTGFTDMIAALTLTGAKRSSAVNTAKTAGVIAVTGTVS